MMTVRMMSRVMEKKAGRCCEGEGEIHPCYSQGHSRTLAPQPDAPLDRDVLSHTQRLLRFVKPVYRWMLLATTDSWIGSMPVCPIDMALP